MLKVALEGQQVLAVVLLEGVGAAAAGADPQLRGDILPRFLVGALKQGGLLAGGKMGPYWGVRLGF